MLVYKGYGIFWRFFSFESCMLGSKDLIGFKLLYYNLSYYSLILQLFYMERKYLFV